MLILGIDTGGTYTDGVILDRDSRTVLYTSKALTTPDDLSVGIEACIRALRFSDWTRVGMVGLSTTLATNAIVEGAGCRVGLILLGRRPDGPIPAAHTVQLDAQVNIRGTVRQPLRTAMIDEALHELEGRCDAIAVSGYASVRNPTQEQIVRQRAAEVLGLPVVCGHEMSGTLGYYERTVTTALNARLLPLIQKLLRDVRKAMDALDIHAPLMVVRGDGSLMRAAYAEERPVETALSGPAASVMGAQFLSGLRNGLVVDMGGTTTDIAAIRDGVCSVSEEGASLSGWRTRVRALEIQTFGLGGDSEITVAADGDIQIGPQKVVPLCRSGISAGRAGLTPTDVLHAAGSYREWDASRAKEGLRRSALLCGMPEKRLEAQLIRTITERLSEDCRMGADGLRETQPVLIGVGAPAASWLPAAAALSGWQCVIPPHAEVANAAGAAVGRVCESAQALVRENRARSSYYIYTPEMRLEAENLPAAQEIARREAERCARERARKAGAKLPEITSREQLTTGADGSFVEWSVTAQATGDPV